MTEVILTTERLLSVLVTFRHWAAATLGNRLQQFIVEYNDPEFPIFLFA